MILLENWWESLQIFHFNNFRNFFSTFIFNFFRATKIFLKYFYWLFLIDIALFFLYGIFCNKFLGFSFASVKFISFYSLSALILLSFLAFTLNAFYLLSIRLRYKKPSKHYFKINFIRYVQLTLFFSVIIFILFNLMVFLGVSDFPRLHWSFRFVIRLLELLVFFYWLDSMLCLRCIFVSIEKAINFFIYNLPFFMFMIFGILFFNFSIKFSFGIIDSSLKLDSTLSTFKQIQVFLASAQNFNIFLYLKLLLFKYMRFFSNHIILTFIFTYYSTRKNNIYVDSVFELED
jgi:hypothetical protein